MASNISDINYSCEICGVEGLTEEEMRTHTKAVHVEGHATCPFCELAAVSSAELLIHVNQAHLDFLTPEAELMAFIDEDNSPSDTNNMSNGHSYSPDDWGASGGVNNINLATNIVNGGGEISPKQSNHPQGSPLRNNLALKLKSPASTLQCPMCPHSSTSPGRLQEHVNREHFDLTSPSVAPASNHDINQPVCPLCTQSFDSVSDLELHVNIEHRDILSPASPALNTCPVCAVELDPDTAAKHIEAHFPVPSPIDREDREARRVQEQREFEMLRAQYGMDNQGNFREQSVTNMQRAVYAGEMSVSDYYERQLDLRAAESCGIDDGSSVTRGIVGRVRAVSLSSPQVTRIYTCTCVDHYAASYGDRGWGCGYRNTQMLISSLLTHTGYNELLYRAWQGQRPPRSAVPSISRVQNLIEQAWAQGFDLQGSEQLGCKLYNTRKWIGATEVVTLLSSLKIKCQLVDFHKPTGPEGTHPELFLWVLRYFQNGGDFIPPLYLQHQGHSRTIMGVEQFRDGTISLLVLDPSHSPYQMGQLADTSTAPSALRLIRKSEAAMKARQYQVVAVVGTIDTESQYQQSKVLRGTRIPQDRHKNDMSDLNNLNIFTRIKDVTFKRFYILQWLPKYKRGDFIADLIAGITIGLTMMPQSIAYASLAELTAQYGLYSAFMGSLIYVFFGTIKEVSIGPTSLMAILSYSYTRDLPVDFMILLAFLAGCVEFTMGLLKLGFLVDFISAPVVSGFTSATSVIIVSTQIKGLLGLTFKSHGFINTMWNILKHLKDIKLGDASIGICSIVFLLTFRKLKDIQIKNKGLKKTLWFLSISRNALIVLICSIIAFQFHKTGSVPFKLSGKVPSGLPQFRFPNMTTTVQNESYSFLQMCEKLGSGLVLVPLVAVLANVAIAKSFAAGQIVDASQEMMTLGLCNIFGSFVQAMPTCGAFTRSAVSNASGVRTPLAGLYSGSLIILALTFLTPYFYFIPKATLSAVLICAVIFMIDYQIITPLWKTNKFDLSLTAITFILSLCFGVERGLLCGVVINIIFLLKLWARPVIHSQICTFDSNEYILIKPEVGLFFPAVDTMRQTICKAANRIGKNRMPILVDCSGILHIDYTAHKGIENLINTFDKKQQLLLFLDVNPLVLSKIKRITEVDDYQFCYTLSEALIRMFGETKTPTSDICPLLIDENEKNLLSRNGSIRKYSLYDNIRLCTDLKDENNKPIV